MKPVLIIRAQPGAGETAARAAAAGLDCRIVPLFEAQALAWQALSADGFDAVMLTSAHAPRLAGPAQAAYFALPCYAVGDSTAAAAERAGYADVRRGSGDGDALLAMMARDGVRRALHLCGRVRRAYAHQDVMIERRAVYAVEGVAPLPVAARAALEEGGTVLLHSPRSAGHFAALCEAGGIDRKRLAVAAISRVTAEAAGDGWRRVGIAGRPRDEALLELAAKLCKTGAQ